MTNQNLTADLLIEGSRGFVARKDHDFKPGEFKRLTNAEIVDGRILSRRCIKQPTYAATSVANTVMSSGVKAIGFYGQWTIYASETEQYALDGVGNRQTMFTPNTMIDLTGDTTGWGRPVGFFEYNNSVYWLVFRYNSAIGTVGIDVYTTPSDLRRDPSSFIAAAAIKVTGISIPYNNTDFSKFKYDNFTIFKDRLWVAIEKTVYFSAATSPSNFDVASDGGFFKFPDDSVNWIMAVGDLVYVICDKSIWTITYTINPNEDATVRKISGDVGGLQGCIYKDTPYFINNDGIFAISNSSVDKVIDSDLDEGLNDFTNQSLTAYQNYLVINKTYQRNTDSLPPPDSATVVGSRVNLWPDPSFFVNPNSVTDYWEPTCFHYLNTVATVTTAYDAFSRRGSSGSLKATISSIAASSLQATVFTKNLSYFFKNTTPVSTNPKIILTKGKTYNLSCYVYRDSATGGANASGFLGLYIFDAVTGLYVKPWYTSSVVTLTANTWVRINVVFQVPDSNPELAVKFQMAANSAAFVVSDFFYIDDLLLEEVNSSVPGTYFDGKMAPDATYSYINKNSLGVVDEKINVAIPLVPSFNYYRNLYPVFKQYVNSNPDDNTYENNTYFVNMDNGAIHVVDYVSRKRDTGTFTSEDYTCEVVYNPNPNPTTATGSLMLRSSDAYIGVGATTYKGESVVAYMEYERTRSAQDKVAVINTGLTTYTTKGVKQYLVIEISQFNPDEVKYLIKKFRNLELMGSLPATEFQVALGFDNAPYDPPYGIIRDIVDIKPLNIGPVIGPRGFHKPHRVGINQRATALNIALVSKNPYATYDVAYDSLEISNLRILYGATIKEIGSISQDLSAVT